MHCRIHPYWDQATPLHGAGPCGSVGSALEGRRRTPGHAKQDTQIKTASSVYMQAQHPAVFLGSDSSARRPRSPLPATQVRTRLSEGRESKMSEGVKGDELEGLPRAGSGLF
jgi:hypothetical protein